MQVFSPNDVFSGGGIDPAAPLQRRVWRGIRGGVLGSAAVTVVVLLLVALVRPPPGDLPAPLWAFIALYFTGGILGGAVYGALRPLLRSLVGTFVFLLALFAVLIALLLLTIALVESDLLSLEAFAIGVATGAPLLALIFTPIFWGRSKGARWTGPAFVVLILILLALRSAGRYVELHPEVNFWIALLHQWPLLVPVGLIALAKLVSRASGKRAV